MNFRQAVLQASKEANLHFGQRVKLRIILAVPAYRRKLEEKLLAKAVKLNVVPASTTLDSALPQEIDWEKVKEFIKEWLPIIIKVILVFFML